MSEIHDTYFAIKTDSKMQIDANLNTELITDSLGRKIDFRHTMISMTANRGARQLKEFGQGVGLGTAKKKAQGDGITQ